MPKKLLILLVVLILGSWFLVDEKRSFVEKLMTILTVIALYVAVRLMTGATIYEILAPLLS